MSGVGSGTGIATAPTGRGNPEPRGPGFWVVEHIEEAEQGLYVLSDFAPYLMEYGAPEKPGNLCAGFAS